MIIVCFSSIDKGVNIFCAAAASEGVCVFEEKDDRGMATISFVSATALDAA